MPDVTPGEGRLAADFENWLVRFDETGRCVSPETRDLLLARLAGAGPAPVILFSHGWNNEYGDATQLYTRFLGCLAVHYASYGADRPKPVFVGVIWPSTWLSFDTGPGIATAGQEVAAVPGSEAWKSAEDLASGLPEPATRDRLKLLLRCTRIEGEAIDELAGLVSEALAGRIGSVPAPPEGLDASVPDPTDVKTALHGLQTSVDAGGVGDELPEGGTIDGPSAAQPQSASLLSYLDPRLALRLASVYQMKDRAGKVGWHGVGPLLHDILERGHGPVYTVGHSFGAKVVLSAMALFEPAASVKPRLRGALLLQPAISYLSFAKQVPGTDRAGGYAAVLGRLAGPIITTYSSFDLPLHDVFHVILRRDGDVGDARIAASDTQAGSPPSGYAALGGYGPRGASEILVDGLLEPGSIAQLPAGARLIGMDGTAKRRISGHGDVTTPYTAWLLFKLMG